MAMKTRKRAKQRVGRSRADSQTGAREKKALRPAAQASPQAKERARYILNAWVLPYAAECAKPIGITPEANAAWFDRYLDRFASAISAGHEWETEGPGVLLVTKKIARHARRLALGHGHLKIRKEDAEIAAEKKECKRSADITKDEKQRLFWCEPQP